MSADVRAANAVFLAVRVADALDGESARIRRQRFVGRAAFAALVVTAATRGVQSQIVQLRDVENQLIQKSGAQHAVGALVDRLEDNASEALAWEDGGNWRSFTWAEYVAQVRAAARAMIALGLAPTQGVGIVGFNSKEWLIADLGAVLAGGFASGIYSTNGPDAVQYVLEHSRAALVVVEGKGQLDKVRSVAGALPGLKAAVVWGDAGSDLTALGPSAPVLAWDAFLPTAPADG